jgi:hypothetical protein
LQEIEFGRFDELERRFGIRRSTAYELINAGKIKSVAVKKKARALESVQSTSLRCALS